MHRKDVWYNYKDKKYEIGSPCNFGQNLFSFKIENYGSTHGPSKEVVPHNIELH
jgi:hypothetical protein